MEDLVKLVLELILLSDETQWLEFKHNNYDPEMIGRDISALANSATLCEREHAYMIWGIDDKTHEIVGTRNDLQSIKIGTQELDNWLRTLMTPSVNFCFHTVEIQEKCVGVLIIDKALRQPVMFRKEAYIRVGSYTKNLNDAHVASLQTMLWKRLLNVKFEEADAEVDLSLRDALSLLSYTVYFDAQHLPQPDDIRGVAHYLLQDGILRKQDNGLYAVTCLGAILFAKKLSSFPKVARNALRVVAYKGKGRINISKESTFDYGYAGGFDVIMKYIEAMVPTDEPIVGAFREKQSAFPVIAIREVVANALIHQDFLLTGTGPVVEFFDNRVEITNPGKPLVAISRIIDSPPRSRNSKLSSLMRRLRMCEELGTGWDKITSACEKAQLPAPKIEAFPDNTRVTVYAYAPFSQMAAASRLLACYQHACLQHMQGETLTNRSLRERFGEKEVSSSTISRLIKDAVDGELIRPVDPGAAPRYMRYVPAWAVPEDSAF